MKMTETTPSFIMQYKESELADDMATGRRADAWATLVERSRNYKDVDEWLDSLKVFEDEYMTAMYSDLPEAKKANGDWKYRKFIFKDEDGKVQSGGLPMSYMSAKSTIRQAKVNSIKIAKKGVALPKSELGKAISAAKDPTTPFQKALNHVKRISQLWLTLSNAEKQTVISATNDLLSIKKS